MADTVPEDWRCAKCDCRSFARVDALHGDGTFKPGDNVRCVNCKDVSFYPDRSTPPSREWRTIDSAPTRKGIYFASKVVHARRWRLLRDKIEWGVIKPEVTL